MQSLPYWRLSGYYFFYFAFIGAFSPYFGLYLQSLSFSAWDIGLLMSQMQLMRLFGPIVRFCFRYRFCSSCRFSYVLSLFFCQIVWHDAGVLADCNLVKPPGRP